MTISKKSKITASRLLLENPYAHIEQMSELSPGGSAAEALQVTRLRMQNPYAYMDELAAPSVVARRTISRGRAWTIAAVEREARELHKRLWRERGRLWRDDAPASPVEMLDPAKACQLFSYDFEVADSLGVYSDRRERIAVAGQIDRTGKVVRISREFDPEVQLFTAAHEVGHLILHPHIDRLHRDRGLNGLGTSRNQVEFEADKFAVFFLLPAKLVREEFALRFLAPQFVPTEEALFALGSGSRNEGRHVPRQRRRMARRLASALSYNGRNFHSLASHFGVTTETMAIRLEELQIVS